MDNASIELFLIKLFLCIICGLVTLAIGCGILFGFVWVILMIREKLFFFIPPQDKMGEDYLDCGTPGGRREGCLLMIIVIILIVGAMLLLM